MTVARVCTRGRVIAPPAPIAAPVPVAPLVIPGVPVSERRHSRVLGSPLAAPRAGVMLHYDDSARDDWAVAWFDDRRCTNGYTWLVLDDGHVVELADPAMRTPHAGSCLTPNANSVFYGVSAATNGVVPATEAQVAAIVEICAAILRNHGWDTEEDGSARIVGHDAQAVWTPAYTRAAGISDERGRALWGQLGRKVDPTGVRRDGRPIIDINQVRAGAARALRDGGGGNATEDN
jgi:hypothetical protein